MGLPGDVRSVRTARRYAVEFCHQAGLPDLATQLVALVVSEFSANVIRHAGGAFRLVVSREQARVTVAVEDSLDCPDPQASDPGLTAESGRGLLVVERIALRWGCERMPYGKRM